MAFQDALELTAKRLASLENPVVFTHLDADGLTSGSIVFKTLQALGRNPTIRPLRQLDQETIAQVPSDAPFVLVDFGSGQLPLLAGKGPGVVIDHHEPTGPAPPNITHLNAIEQGFSGAKEISSSGMAYFLCSRLASDDSFVPLAITGAVGDVQAQSGLIGLNRELLKAGALNSTVQARHGLPFFGRETRELRIFLSYATDPYLPGLTGSVPSCEKFLTSIGLDPTATYNSLPPSGTSKLVTALHQHAIQSYLEPWQIKRLVTEFYIFPGEPAGWEVRDATEFSTLLNACGRNDEPQIGIDICLGNRSGAYQKARALLAQHRENLRKGLQELAEKGTTPIGKHLQTFYSSSIKPTIIGVIIGMALGGRMIDPTRAIIAASDQDENSLKISARATPELVRAGLNLSAVMRKVSAEFGGAGGGHNIAAGATIPKGEFERFAIRLEEEIAKQLSGINASYPKIP
jgi:single-stranded-DNA-specific exonuclease